MSDEMPPDDFSWEEETRILAERWERLQRAFAAVPAPRLDLPGACGEWSARLLMSHIAFWDRQAMRQAARVLAGEPPLDEDADTLNAPLAREHAGESVATARADMESAHAELLAFIAGLPRDDPRSTVAFWDMSPDTWRHYDEHVIDLQQWVRDPDAAAPNG